MGRGLGLVGAYAVRGAQDSLDKILADRIAAKRYADLQKQQEFENQQRLEEAAQRRKYQDESVASLTEQRAANAELRRQNTAATLSEDLMPGDVLDASQAELLKGAGRGSLMAQQSGTLPSRQFSGFLRVGPGAGPTGGVLRTTTQAGHPAQDVYRGTRSQRSMQAMLDQFPAGSRERAVLDYENATGRNAPSIFMPTPPREPTPHYSLQPTYDETGRPTGGIRFNQLTGEATPIEVGGNLRAPRRGLADDPELPRGVSNYLLQLRSKSGSYEQALGELARALPQIQGAHPSFNAVKAGNALRQLFAQPTGQDGVFLGAGGGPSGNRFLGEAPAGGRGAASSGMTEGGGTITRAELRAVAQRLGITEAQAAQQAHARGMQVE